MISRESRKEKKVMVQEEVYTEDAAQVQLEHRVCLGEVAKN